MVAQAVGFGLFGASLSALRLGSNPASMSSELDNGDDKEIEKGIDAIDVLRVTMRRAGMTDCADALDDVFVRCLKGYMDRRDAAGHGNNQPHPDLS